MTVQAGNQRITTLFLATFWAMSATDLLAQLASGEAGLTQVAAKKKQRQVGPNRIKPAHTSSGWRLLFS